MKKIIFVSNLAFNNYQFERFHIQKYIDIGWQVECWRLLYLSNKNHIKLYKKDEEFEDDKKIVFRFSSHFKMIKHAFSLKEEFYIFDIFLFRGHAWLTYIILKILGGKIVQHNPTSFPIINIDHNILKSKNYFKFKLRRVLIKIFTTIFMKISKIINYNLHPKIDFLFFNGNVEKKNAEKNNKFINLISCHAHDYDKFLSKKNHKDKILDGKYAVFLDMNLTKPFDSIIASADLVVTKSKYIKSLNIFFSELKRLQPDQKLVIAQHPNLTENCFENYLSYSGKTAELVKDSTLVIAHDTLSIQYAVFWKKPIIFITTDEIENRFFKSKSIELVANNLGKKVINVDEIKNKTFDEILFKEQLVVDTKLYDQFINNYIKSKETSDKLSWEIISETIK